MYSIAAPLRRSERPPLSEKLTQLALFINLYSVIHAIVGICTLRSLPSKVVSNVVSHIVRYHTLDVNKPL
jgi:hypothetical protein